MNREEYYAQIAARYIPSDPFWRTYHRQRFQTFNGLMPPSPRRVLDFGCGTAENVVLLSELGHDVVGIDPVAEMTDLGRERLRAGGWTRRVWRSAGSTGCVAVRPAASIR